MWNAAIAKMSTVNRLPAQLRPSGYHNTKSRPQWRGIDRGDDRYRLYQKLPHYFPGKIRRRYRRGRLMESFNQVKLIKIAWKVGVSNPDGFDRSDCEFLGCPLDEGFEHFVDGWNGTKKLALMNYIWNHLNDSNAITAI